MKLYFPHNPALINLNWNNSDKCAKSSKEEPLINYNSVSFCSENNSFLLFTPCTHPFKITQTRITSLRKSSSLSRSLSRRMSERRLSSEAHLRLCRTVRVMFSVSWQNLNKWDRFAQTWVRPAGGVARGLGGLNHRVGKVTSRITVSRDNLSGNLTV